MSKYKIGVTCLIEDYLIEEVEAATAEEAHEKAQKQAEARWDVLRTETQFVSQIIGEIK